MKIIRFVPDKEDKELMLLQPVATKKMVPDWYKNGEAEFFDEESQSMSPGMKSCAPFLDVMTLGYFLLTPFDIFVSESENGELQITWNGPDYWQGFIGERPKALGATIPRPAGHHPNGLVWSSRWGWKTPKGHSTIVIHPVNRYDLPFTTLGGSMESDKLMVNGNIPFFMKQGFTGTIPAGTPYAQVIPFKRQSWFGHPDYSLSRVSQKQSYLIHGSGEEAVYKRKLWVKKRFDYEER